MNHRTVGHCCDRRFLPPTRLLEFVGGGAALAVLFDDADLGFDELLKSEEEARAAGGGGFARAGAFVEKAREAREGEEEGDGEGGDYGDFDGEGHEGW